MERKRLLTSIFACGLLMCLSGTPAPSEASFFHKNTYSQDSIQKRIVKEAKKQGVCPYLALSVAKQESGFNTNARSPVGAIGLFQLMPDTARELNVNPHDVNENIHGGVKYLKQLSNQYSSKRLVIAAYNAGPGCVQRYGGVPPYRETKTYVRNVMQYYYEYMGNPSLISSY